MTRFRFSAGSLADLGVNADTPVDDLPARLGFAEGVKITKVTADGDGIVLNLTGVTFKNGGGEPGAWVTGDFYVSSKGAVTFGGFRPDTGAADDAEPAAADLTKGA